MNIKKITIGIATGIGIMAATILPTFANTISPIDFESYTIGNINGQNGWMKTGSYDVAVANVSSFSNASGFGFGTKALRASNAVTSGSFGDQTFSPGVDPAGESLSNSHFEASFDIGSTQSVQQPGLFLSVSPDDGNGSRMSYAGFDDQGDGIHVIFYDVDQPTACGTVGCANFVSNDVATLDRTSAHTIKFVMDFVPGDHNDIVKLYVDGSLKITGRSWEDYYRNDPEQAGNGNVVPTTSKLLFRAGGTAAPATSGNGYLIDNVILSSGAFPVSGEITNPATDGDHVSGVVNFTATYTDEGPDVDAVQWAIRQGSCSTGTVLGNVDGHTDTATWDGASFSFSTDTSLLTPGNYCFVFNPTDDPGQADVRVTRNFVVDAAETPTPTPNPLIPAECAGMDLNGKVIIGSSKSETLNGTNKNDLILGRGGSDTINGGNGDDCIVAGNGSDTIHGNNGNDIILGGGGSDLIYGDNGDDTIYGQGGADSMYGGNGKDMLNGGAAYDSAHGDNGQDTCIAESKNSCEL